MGYFRIVGEGSQEPEALELVVATASEARAVRNRFQRLCGRHGKVVIWGKNGRAIGEDRLRRLIEEESSRDQEVPSTQGEAAGIDRHSAA